MTLAVPHPTSNDRPPHRRYLRPVAAVHFPAFDAEPMGETPRHLALRTALWQAIDLAFGDRVTVSSDQFVYFNGRDPKACCAPDVFVCLRRTDPLPRTWKTWERGTPELAIEIVSDDDARDAVWNEKLDRYRALGCRELVRFDAESALPLRIWDRIEDDLVERDPADPLFARCDTLEAYWAVRRDEKYGPWLYLARYPEGREPFPSPAEALKTETEARQQAEEQRQQAEARVRELEAQIEKKVGRRG
jgi:Uma2 family endonuclease